MLKPDWNAFEQQLGANLSDEQLNVEWLNACKHWLESIVDEFGSGYRIQETKNFLIVSNESDRYLEVFSSFLERTLKRILTTLSGIASDEGFGKNVALIFQDIEHYYDYIHRYLPDEGEFGLSSGMYINDGYGHFVFPSQDIDFAEPIAVHEMTHACLVHLPIPTWLNEGLAVLMEEVLAGNRLHLDHEIFNHHQNYWNETTIQSFWSGESFYASDEGQELSYHFAHILVRNIAQNASAFKDFVNSANYNDAGQKAAQTYLNQTLENLVGSFLGEGNWMPNESLNHRIEQASVNGK